MTLITPESAATRIASSAPAVTKTGHVLTEDDIGRLAREAEHGYDVRVIRPERSLTVEYRRQDGLWAGQLTRPG